MASKKVKTVLVNIDDLSRQDLVRTFNRRLKWLMKKLYVVSGKSVKIDSLKNQLFIGITADFDLAMKHAGPEIHKFKEAIRSENVEYFCKMDLSKVPTSNDKYDANVIAMLQNELPKFTEYEASKIFKCVNMLLDAYLEFILFCRLEPEGSKVKAPDDKLKQYGYSYMPQGEYKKLQDERKKEEREKEKRKREAKRNGTDKNKEQTFDMSDDESF